VAEAWLSEHGSHDYQERKLTELKVLATADKRLYEITRRSHLRQIDIFLLDQYGNPFSKQQYATLRSDVVKNKIEVESKIEE